MALRRAVTPLALARDITMTSVPFPAGSPRWKTWLPPTLLGAALGLIAAQAANAGSVPYYLAALAAVLPFVATILGGFRRLCLAVLVLDIPLMWDVNFFFRGDDPYPGGLNVSVTTLALAGLFGLWASEALARRDRARPVKLRFDGIAVAFVALTALSVLAAGDKVLAAFGIALLVQTFLIFLYVSSVVRERKEVLFIFGMLVAVVAFEGLAVIAAWKAGHNFSFNPLSVGGEPAGSEGAFRRSWTTPPRAALP